MTRILRISRVRYLATMSVEDSQQYVTDYSSAFRPPQTALSSTESNKLVRIIDLPIVTMIGEEEGPKQQQAQAIAYRVSRFSQFQP